MSYQTTSNYPGLTPTIKQENQQTILNAQGPAQSEQKQYAMPPPPTQGKNHLPAFLNKLYGMVNSPESDAWVHWNEDGTSFIIPNSQALAQQILGHHFKHNNFPSFVRQLNMYGFHKVPHLSHGVLHNDGLPEVWEFINPNFRRDTPEDMRRIERKKGEAERARSAAKQQPDPAHPASSPRISQPADVAIVRAELGQLGSRQNMIKDELLRLSSSTEGLWRYALETRLRYEQQQLKLDNIIRVLSDVFRKRSTELPSKIRGYIEAPVPQPQYDDASSAQASVSSHEQTHQDVMKMLANGKVPAGFHDAFQNYLQSVSQPSTVQPASTPISHPSPTTHDSPEDLRRVQDNSQQQEQVQDWLNNTNQYLDGLGVDLNPNLNYGDYLLDTNLAYDSLPQTDAYNVPTLQSPWISTPPLPEMNYAQGTPVTGQKRTFQHEEDESQNVLKKSRK
jgi:hypothetical protein